MTDPERPTHRLSDLGFRALKWNYLGNAVRGGSQLVIGIVLSRLLGPEAFGTVAIAWLVIGLGMLVADAGFGSAVVQQPSLCDRDIRFAFTVQVFVGAVLSFLVAAGGGLLAQFFGKPDAAPVVRAMGAVFLVQSFGLTGLALLRRRLDYRTAQRITIASYLVGYACIAIPLAYLGAGAWSLVSGQIAQAAVASVASIIAARMPIRPVWRASSNRILAFGGWIIGANASSWALSNLDGLLIGRLLGVVELGVYTRAMTLVTSPVASIAAGMQNVLFSACSRAQANAAGIRRAFLAAHTAITFICLPVFAAIATVPRTVVVGLLGEQWAAAAAVLVPLSLAMPVNAALAMVGPVLTAIGRVRVELTTQAIVMAMMIPTVYSLSRVSLTAVAWGVFGVFILRYAMLMWSLVRALSLRWSDVLVALRWPAACAAVAVTATWSCDRLLGTVPPAVRLGADCAVAATALAVFVRIVGGRVLRGPHGDLLAGGDRLPAPLRAWLRVGTG